MSSYTEKIINTKIIYAIPEDFITYDEYGFGGYGVITKEVIETIIHVARIKRLLPDPVYTAKVMYGLIDLAHNGVLEKTSNVVFKAETRYCFGMYQK